MTNVSNGGFITEIECTVCLEVPEEDTRILQCNNGHIFCQVCYFKLNKCPACRLKLATEEENGPGPIRCLIAENLVRKFSKQKIKNDVEQKININGEAITLRPEKLYFNSGGITYSSISKNKLRKEIMTEQPLATPRNDSYQQKYFGVYWGRRLPKDIQRI